MRFKHQIALIIACIMLLSVIGMAVFAPFLAPYNPLKQNLKTRLTPPVWANGGSFEHILGTDQLGRDIFSRIIYGARVSCIVGLAVVLISGAIGMVLGIIAGFYEGWFSNIIMRLCDLQSALPFTLLAILFMSVMGSGLANVIFALSITGWMGYARLIRAQTLQTKQFEFVKASKLLGAKDYHLMFCQILPNVITHAIILAAFSVAQTMITEAGLTFLGLGVEPSIPSWGGMLSDGRAYIQTGWWIAVIPGVCIMFTVMAVNAIGQWAREKFDPRSSKY
jgi:peptide/nickel transport system permease protein